MAITEYDSCELTLQKLLLGFMKFAHDHGEESFPPFESSLWHEFLYLLKLDFERIFPELKCIGVFDWDGFHPKCREFSVAMFGIRYQCFSKIPNERVFLNPETKNSGNSISIPSLVVYYPNLAEATIFLSHQIPGFFKPR